MGARRPRRALVARRRGCVVGTPAMNAPVRAMASDGDVRWNTAIDTLTYDGSHDGQWRIGNERFDAAIVAVPAEQVAPLVAAHDVALADAARSAVSDPCLTVMAAFDGPAPIDRDPLTDFGIIGSAVHNSAKPARTGPEAWVLQASADWSRAHIEDALDTVQRASRGVRGSCRRRVACGHRDQRPQLAVCEGRRVELRRALEHGYPARRLRRMAPRNVVLKTINLGCFSILCTAASLENDITVPKREIVRMRPPGAVGRHWLLTSPCITNSQVQPCFR